MVGIKNFNLEIPSVISQTQPVQSQLKVGCLLALATTRIHTRFRARFNPSRQFSCDHEWDNQRLVADEPVKFEK